MKISLRDTLFLGLCLVSIATAKALAAQNNSTMPLSCQSLITNNLQDQADRSNSDYRVSKKTIEFLPVFEHVPFTILPHRNLIAAQFSNEKQNLLTLNHLGSGAVETSIDLGKSPWHFIEASADDSHLTLIRVNKSGTQEVDIFNLKIDSQNSNLQLVKEKTIALAAASFYRISPNLKWVVANNYKTRTLLVGPLELKTKRFAKIINSFSKVKPQPLYSIAGAAFEFKTMAFSSNGEYIIVPNQDHSALLKVEFSNYQNPKTLNTSDHLAHQRIINISISDAGLIAVLSQSPIGQFKANLFDSTGQLLNSIVINSDNSIPLNLKQSTTTSIKISPNGKILAIMANRGLYLYSLIENRYLNSSNGFFLNLTDQTQPGGIINYYPVLDVKFMADQKTAWIETALGLFEISFRD